MRKRIVNESILLAESNEQEINYMLDLYAFVWAGSEDCSVRSWLLSVCECEWKKTFEKEADQTVTPCISFRSAQS